MINCFECGKETMVSDTSILWCNECEEAESKAWEAQKRSGEVTRCGIFLDGIPAEIEARFAKGMTERAKILRTLRVKHGIVMHSMAKALCMSSSDFSAMERGSHPEPDDLVDKILKAFPQFGEEVREPLMKAIGVHA